MSISWTFGPETRGTDHGATFELVLQLLAAGPAAVDEGFMLLANLTEQLRRDLLADSSVQAHHEALGQVSDGEKRVDALKADANRLRREAERARTPADAVGLQREATAADADAGAIEKALPGWRERVKDTLRSAKFAFDRIVSQAYRTHTIALADQRAAIGQELVGAAGEVYTRYAAHCTALDRLSDPSFITAQLQQVLDAPAK